MSTPEQPDTPPLTRKQMRDLRNTGVTPVITPETLAAAPVAAAPVEEAPPAPPVPAPVPLPRAAAPVVVPDAPVADASVDLGVSPLTRRQARQQERIRTASVPVITPEVAAAHAAAMAASAPAVVEEPAEAPEADEYSGGETPTEAMRDLFGIAAEEPAPEPDQSEPEAEVVEPLVELVEAEPETVDVVEVVEVEPAADESAADESAAVESDDLQAALGLSAEEPETEPQTAEEPDAESDRPVLNPLFGSAFVASEPESVELPASFDDLLARGTTGSTAPPSALILTQSTGGSPIVAPVTATGEMLVTGTLNLPEGLGSIGHAPGAADGKEVDAVLVDGELPAHSSPTPIAASAAISTVKTNGDVIKPPAPEKGSRLMMSLAITAGVLALALVGVLILAFVNGVF